MNAFQLLDSKGELVFDVGRSVSIMRQVFVLVKSKMLFGCTQGQMPPHPFFFPVFVPFHFATWRDEVLHLHLFEFAHAEDKLSGYDFIPKRLTDLSYTKWNFLPRCFHHVQKIDADSLRGFGTEV